MEKLSGIKRIFMGALVVVAIAGGMGAATWTNFSNNSNGLAFDAPDEPSLFVIGPGADNDRVVIRRGTGDPCEEHETASLTQAHFVHVEEKKGGIIVEKRIEDGEMTVIVRNERGEVISHQERKVSARHKDRREHKADKPASSSKKDRKSPLRTFIKALKILVNTAGMLVDGLTAVKHAAS